MSILRIGTLCITVGARDPRNNGRIVRVLARVGPVERDACRDGYRVEVVNGVPFATTLRRAAGGGIRVLRDTDKVTVADRSKLRPLLRPDIPADSEPVREPEPEGRSHA